MGARLLFPNMNVIDNDPAEALLVAESEQIIRRHKAFEALEAVRYDNVASPAGAKLALESLSRELQVLIHSFPPEQEPNFG